jgi:hypothetical protein
MVPPRPLLTGLAKDDTAKRMLFEQPIAALGRIVDNRAPVTSHDTGYVPVYSND